MGARNFPPDSLSGKFDVSAAVGTGNFEAGRLLQDDGFPAMRTGNLLPHILCGKLDSTATKET